MNTRPLGIGAWKTERGVVLYLRLKHHQTSLSLPRQLNRLALVGLLLSLALGFHAHSQQVVPCSTDQDCAQKNPCIAH